MATAKEQDCSMPAAEAVLAPSNRAFSNGLKLANKFLNLYNLTFHYHKKLIWTTMMTLTMMVG